MADKGGHTSERERPVQQRTEELVKQAQLAERERDRLLTLIDSMNEGVWFVKADGSVVLANSTAKRQAVETGMDPDALSRSPTLSLLSQVDLLTPDGKPLELSPLMAVFQGKPFRGVEIAVRNKTTGETFYRRVSANPVWDSEKRIEGVITIVHDITASKRAEEEASRLQEQLRQVQKMESIGTLAGGIAHDFNNMLAIIIGNAELALEDIEDDDGPKRNIEQIIEASKRARDLVKQMLTFSKKTERDKRPLSLTPLIKETYRILQGSLPSTIRLFLDVHTESDAILADPSQIEQLLMNLATNAADAMRQNGGTLKMSLTNLFVGANGPKPDEAMAPGLYMKLTVEDTGAGMTEEVRRRIFEPFFTTKGAGPAVAWGWQWCMASSRITGGRSRRDPAGQRIDVQHLSSLRGDRDRRPEKRPAIAQRKSPRKTMATAERRPEAVARSTAQPGATRHGES